MIALIENVGFGGKFAAPAVHKVYETYLSQCAPAPGAGGSPVGGRGGPTPVRRELLAVSY